LRVFGKFEITILKEQTKELIEGNFFFEKKIIKKIRKEK